MNIIRNTNQFHHLLNTNLNLMVYFLVLIEESHITAAAKRANISQPAMSSALKECRAIFQDPLLVKSSRGLVPTEKATRLYSEIQKGFNRVSTAISDTDFDPATSDFCFNIMMTDYAGAILLPKLLSRLGRIAPGIRLKVLPMTIDPQMISAEDVDLSIGFLNTLLPKGFQEITLFDEYYVCLLSKDHPRIRTTLTLENFLNEKHMVVREENGAIGVVNSALMLLKKHRDVVLEVPNFLLFPFISAQTELLITTTSRNALLFKDYLSLRVLPVPLQLPTVPVKCFWHERVHNSDAHSWLRNLVVEVAQEVV